MKTLLLSLFAFTALALTASAQVALRPGDVKIMKVLPSVVKTPEFQITGGQNKRYTLGSWLEVEVEFETIPEKIDELTFKYTILINGQLLVGEVTHVEIPKGREHYSVAYVSPRGLDAVMGGKPLSPAAIQGIWVEATASGMILSSQSLKPGQIPNRPQLPGLVLNKAQTPFAPLYWDRYEALKAGSSSR